MLKFVEERWEDVAGEEEGVRRAMTEEFGFLYASQVLQGYPLYSPLQALYGEYGCDLSAAAENFNAHLVLLLLPLLILLLLLLFFLLPR